MLDSKGIFFECLPDDPLLCKDPVVLKTNQKRLRFYEKYGATPIINTKYETPVKKGADNPPYLVVDTLGQERSFKKSEMREIVRAILHRKYADTCNERYVAKVLASITEDPVLFRPSRYVSAPKPESKNRSLPPEQLIALVYNRQHSVHHIQERGYVESPVRVGAMLSALDRTGLFIHVPSRPYADRHITAVHDRKFVNYLKRVCAAIPEKESVYPYVFPIRNNTRPPTDLPMRAGYYCIDTFTPLNKNAYLAARSAVNCALTAADAILGGSRLAYALVRPPGHHAERKVFGGFCYFNSNAIAANHLSRHGRVAILDIDYHHGNGQQDIFYERRDVLTVSIHGHPRFAYPFFTGFAEERGEGDGKGFNLNYPMAEHLTTAKYLETLRRALRKIVAFKPAYLVVALGLDTARGDPTGTWMLDPADFEAAGRMVGGLDTPKLFVQEGGYKTNTIGKNIASFFKGVWKATFDGAEQAG